MAKRCAFAARCDCGADPVCPDLVGSIKMGLGEVDRLGTVLMFCLRQSLTESQNPSDNAMKDGLMNFYERVVKV